MMKSALKQHTKSSANPINTANGEIIFNLSVLVSPAVSLLQSRSLHPNAEFKDMQTGYAWLNFKNIKSGKLVWAIKACFEGETLRYASLSFYEFDEKILSWDDVCKNYLEQEKSKYENWFRQNIGAQNEFAWGKIEPYYDPRSYSAGIWVSYR